MYKRLYFLLLGIAALMLATIQACKYLSCKEVSEEQIPGKISYNFDIRPILSDKCFACHGPDANKRQVGLRLDIPEHAYQELPENPTAFALVPGNPALSQVFVRISSEDSTMIMPPVESKLKLTDREIKLIKKWIEQGAEYESHWAFVPPVAPGIPEVNKKDWAKNEIDHFVLSKIEESGLSPNQEANKERLLKRVSFDLTGLPPDLAMMENFLADTSKNAYEKVVDQLLASEAYGEKMAVNWLDIARYADSYGYQMDNYRSQWPWRDWVIHAFNQNISYDSFITWQLAGDLLPNATKEQILATGFNRNHKITEEGAVDEEEYRIEYVKDRTNTLGKGLMGVTIECANCHDHKYDPFSQKEYFQLFAFFNNVTEISFKSTAIDPTIGTPESYAKKPLIDITNEDVKSLLKFINKPDTSKLIVSVMEERDTLRNTHVLERGVFNAYGEEVQHGTPHAILPFNNKYPKNRLGLAQWLFQKENPLTSRVFVNQMWQEFFGKGIVTTPGDFGMQGALPSHPKLLDWLAVDFMDHGWDTKRLIKQIVVSATYRQSTIVTDKKRKADPENVLLSRAPRYRLKAEFIRDMVLASSGLLVKTLGGPSAKPYQPEGLWEGATAGGSTLAYYEQNHGDNLYRRGLYTFVKRTVPPPSMLIFDASNRDQCEIGRTNTNTPLQALVMMNDPVILEASRVLAANLLKEETESKDKIIKAFRLIVCRKPYDNEIIILTDYYQKLLKTMKIERAGKLLAVGEYPLPEGLEKTTLAAMMQVVNTIYNLEEVITKS